MNIFVINQRNTNQGYTKGSQMVIMRSRVKGFVLFKDVVLKMERQAIIFNSAEELIHLLFTGGGGGCQSSKYKNTYDVVTS